jgi:hypothetical protein
MRALDSPSVGRNVHVVRPLALALAEQMHWMLGRGKSSKLSDLSCLQPVRLWSVLVSSFAGAEDCCFDAQ